MSQERKSHLIPRSAEGRMATVAFLVVFLLSMPPFTHVVLDRPDIWILGVPLFFAALFLVYSVLIGVLVWALRKGV